MYKFYVFFRFLLAAMLFATLTACDADIANVPQAVLGHEKLAELADVCPADLVSVIRAEYNSQSQTCEASQSSCFKKCRRDDSNACLDLANIYVLDDNNRAVSQLLFKHSCQLGLPSGCTNAAAGLRIRDNLSAKQKTCVARSFREACKAGDSWGCAMRGMQLAEGEFTERNDDEALKALTKACSLATSETDEPCQFANKYVSMIGAEGNASK